MSWEQTGRDETGPVKRGGLGIEVVLFGIVALAIGAFIGQNTNKVKIDWTFLHFSAPLWLVILIVLIIGALLDRLVTIIMRHRRNRRD
jgi:uncharacterized integral membrane protein